MEIDYLYKHRYTRPLFHGLFWLIFVFAGSFIFSYQQDFPYIFYLLNFAIHLPVYILFTYLVSYRLVPRLLLRRRYISFISALVFFTLVVTIIKVLISRHVYYEFFIPKVLHPEAWFTSKNMLLSSLWLLGTSVLFSMFKYYKDWVISEKAANEAERKRLVSELQLLKAQLNPHFLFNTFNNLYQLSLQKSDKTPELINKISELFHYILYECNAMEVPVSKEIKLIENYIELELLRYADRLDIQFHKELKDEDCYIPPMLLFTIVENCFKHGSSKDPGNPWIELSIMSSEQLILFTAKNSVHPESVRSSVNNKGIGLSNIKKRLELMYPGKHRLFYTSEDSSFYVELEIINPRNKNSE